jgi:hypothetical protein
MPTVIGNGYFGRKLGMTEPYEVTIEATEENMSSQGSVDQQLKSTMEKIALLIKRLDGKQPTKDQEAALPEMPTLLLWLFA